MLKLRPRVNGQTEQPKWEQDDADDKLADKLASEPPEFVPDDIPTLPSMPQPAVQRATPQPQKPKETVNVKDLMETLLEAWTNPTVRMWVDGADLCFEQVNLEKRQKNTWKVGFSHVKTSSVKLLK